MARPTARPLHRGATTRNPIAASAPDPALTIAPTADFIFAQETKKGTIMAVGQSKPSMLKKAIEMAMGSPQHEPKHQDFEGMEDIVRAFGSLYEKVPVNEPDAVTMRQTLVKSVSDTMAAHAHAVRRGPSLILGVMAACIAGTIWFKFGREVAEELK